MVMIKGQEINIKKIGSSMLETMVINVIEENHPQKEEIVNYYFKKFKYKPCKKMDGKMTFIECAMKYDVKLLFKYVTDLNINAPNYNVINICVKCNKLDLLEKYIKMKGVKIDQIIDDDTPLTLSIKNKNIGSFEILKKHKCLRYTRNQKGDTPLNCLILEMIKDEKNEHERFFENVLNYLLQEKITIDVTKLQPYHEKLILEYKEILDKKNIINSCSFNKIRNLNNFDSDKHNTTYLQNLELSEYNLVLQNYLYFNCCDMATLIELMKKDKIEYFKNIITRRPHILFGKSCSGSEMSQYICSHDTKLLDYLGHEFTEIVASEYMYGFLHTVVRAGKFEVVKKILQEYPEKYNEKTGENRTLIESVLVSEASTDDIKIEYIELFRNHDVDPNFINDLNTCSFHVAVQYCSLKVINHLSQYIKSNVTDEHFLKLICATEKLDVFDILIKNDHNIMKSYSSILGKQQIPTCINIAIIINNPNALKYLFDTGKYFLNENEKKASIKLAKKMGCCKDIFLLIDSDFDVSNISDIDLDVVRLNTLFVTYSNEYIDDEHDILSYVKMIVNTVLKSVNATEEMKRDPYFLKDEIDYFNSSSYIFSDKFINKQTPIITSFLKSEMKYFDITDFLSYSVNGDIVADNYFEKKEIILKHRTQLENFLNYVDKLFDYVVDRSNSYYESLSQDIVNGCYEYADDFSDSDSDSDESDSQDKSENDDIEDYSKSYNPDSLNTCQCCGKFSYCGENAIFEKDKKYRKFLLDSYLNKISQDDEISNRVKRKRLATLKTIFSGEFDEQINIELLKYQGKKGHTQGLGLQESNVIEYFNNENDQDEEEKQNKEEENKEEELNEKILLNVNNKTIKDFRNDKYCTVINEPNKNVDTIKTKTEKKISKLKLVTGILSFTEKQISTMLSRVMYPFVQPSYPILKEKLSEKYEYIEENNRFILCENGVDIAIIYKNNKNNIPAWIKHYGYNICIENKLDDNHMFPFGVDILLTKLFNENTNKIKCFYGSSPTSTCLYFFGKVLIKNKWIKGHYEYFFNNKNILFHRLFKPMTIN